MDGENMPCKPEALEGSSALVSDKIDLKTNFKWRYQKVFGRMKVINPEEDIIMIIVYTPNDRASKYVKERKRQFHGPHWRI